VLLPLPSLTVLTVPELEFGSEAVLVVDDVLAEVVSEDGLDESTVEGVEVALSVAGVVEVTCGVEVEVEVVVSGVELADVRTGLSFVFVIPFVISA